MTAPATMRINTLTAGPLLRLLLALDGMEPPAIDPQRGWKVFQSFLAMPAESRDDIAWFQAVWAAELRQEPMLYCAFVRQLTDQGEEESDDATRTVNLEYSYALPYSDDLDEVRVLVADFPSLAEFAGAVEQLPHFAVMKQEPAFTCELYEELGEG